MESTLDSRRKKFIWTSSSIFRKIRDIVSKKYCIFSTGACTIEKVRFNNLTPNIHQLLLLMIQFTMIIWVRNEWIKTVLHPTLQNYVAFRNKQLLKKSGFVFNLCKLQRHFSQIMDSMDGDIIETSIFLVFCEYHSSTSLTFL